MTIEDLLKVIPPEVDWVELGQMSVVLNQQRCNSCYTFSTTEAIAAMHAIKWRRRIELSKQELLDCDDENEEC